jgi:hypothetical protein
MNAPCKHENKLFGLQNPNPMGGAVVRWKCSSCAEIGYQHLSQEELNLQKKPVRRAPDVLRKILTFED